MKAKKITRELDWDSMDEKTANQITASLGDVRANIGMIQGIATRGRAYTMRPNRLLDAETIKQLTADLERLAKDLRKSVDSAFGSHD